MRLENELMRWRPSLIYHIDIHTILHNSLYPLMSLFLLTLNLAFIILTTNIIFVIAAYRVLTA